MPRFITEPSAPVFSPCGDGGFPLEKWSGREDSNLRPLPPEGVGPSRIRWLSAISLGRHLRFERPCSFLVHGLNRFLNLGPCLFGGSVVYFIQSGAFVKIGYCERDPMRRLEKLQVGNPIKLVLLALIAGGRDDEAAWHIRYDKQRERGEWFRLDRKMIKALTPHMVDHDEVSRLRPERKINGVDARLIHAYAEAVATGKIADPFAQAA